MLSVQDAHEQGKVPELRTQDLPAVSGRLIRPTITRAAAMTYQEILDFARQQADTFAHLAPDEVMEQIDVHLERLAYLARFADQP